MVFLTVDYLRRLAIDSAQQRQLRLVLQPTALEKTGLGISLLALTAILFIFYIIVLCTDLPPESTSSSEGWQGMEKKAFLERLGSFGAVLLYFLNLRNLVESPRVPFHYISTSTIQDTSLADYLKSQRGAGFAGSCSWLRSSIARVSRALAGEDLELFINAGRDFVKQFRYDSLFGEGSSRWLAFDDHSSGAYPSTLIDNLSELV